MLKLWPDTQVSLPFLTTGRMMHLGTRGQKEIWIAFISTATLDQSNIPPDMTPIIDIPFSALFTAHAYMVVMFFTYVVSQMYFQDIYCEEHYPN